MSRSSKLRALARNVVLACVVALPVAANAVSITETFRNATAPGWDLIGSAVLTGDGTTDPVGDGWLRLTSNANGKAGSAIYNTAFPSTEGVQVTFQYATYGGNGADGFTFYLIDGSTASPTVGAAGGSLGYAPSGGGSAPGVTNGYVGIGFDEYGNFSNLTSTGCSATYPCVVTPNQVVVRGAGNGTSGYPVLAAASATIATGSRADAYTVRITITPAPNPVLTVERDTGAGFTTLISGLSLAGNGPVPATFKMGFSAATGGLNNFHEIRFASVLNANGTATSVPTIGAGGLAVMMAAIALMAAWTRRRR